MGSDKKVCKICKVDVQKCSLLNNKVDTYEVVCPNCGYYLVSDSFLATSTNIPKEDLLLFSGYLRNYSTLQSPVFVTSDFYSKISDIIQPFKRISVPDKVQNIIRAIYGRMPSVWAMIQISFNEVHSFYLSSPDDLREILEYLRQQLLIRFSEDNRAALFTCYPTIAGWEKYESLKEINLNSKNVFVAMSFDPAMDALFKDYIYPACEACGFKAERVDSAEHNEKICDRIIAKINASRFVIADFTQNKHGVYFEAGYAMGFGIPIIWTCSQVFLESEELHFDTRQYNHIIWENENDLKQKLIARIKATIR